MATMDYGDYTTATCDYQIYAPPTASGEYVYVDGDTTSSADVTCTWGGTSTEWVDNSVETVWRKDVSNDMRILRSTRIAAEEHQVQAKKEQEKRDNAEKRATELLKSLIGKVDYELYLKEGYVQVEGKGGKAYKIVPGRTIEILKGGVHENSLCIATRDVRLPPSDEVVWKKLMLEGDKKGLLRIANLAG